MNEENKLNETSIDNLQPQISPPLEEFEPVFSPENVDVVPEVEPVLPSVDVAPVLEPVIEPLEQPVNPVVEETYVAEPVISDVAIGNQNADTLETQPSGVDANEMSLEPVIEGLSVDPMLAAGLPDVNSVPRLEPTPEPKKKKRNKKGIIVVLLLLVVIAAAVVYYVLTSNPHNIYKAALTKVFNTGRESIIQQVDLNTPMTYSGNLKLETNLEDFEELSNYSYDYLFGLDVQNNKAELMLGLNEKDKSLLEAVAYFVDKKLYLDSEKLYDKLILLEDADLDLSELTKNYSKDDILYLYNKLEQALQNSLTKEDFLTQNTSIAINGKSTKVKENYVLLTSQNIGKIVGRFLNTFKNDNKAIEIIAKIIDTPKEDIIALFDEIINQEFSGEGTVRLSFYTKPFINTVVGYKIVADEVEVVNATFDGAKGKVIVNLDGVLVTFDINGNVTDCTITAEEEVLGTAKITKISNEEYKVEVSVSGINVEMSMTNKKEDNNLSTHNIVLSVNIPEEDLNIKVTLDGKLELNRAIADLDTSGAKDVNTMSESELEQIMNKLETILEPTALYGILESVLSSDYNTGLNYVDPMCEKATCNECDGDSCECQYYDNTFTLQTITCPNPSYY